MKDGKKLTALLMVLAMLFSMLPTTVLAAENTDDVVIAENEMSAENEEVMPAGELVAEGINGVTVSVKYDEDTFPESTTMSVNEITDEKELNETKQFFLDTFVSENNESKNRLDNVRLFNIQFYNIDGEVVIC